MAAEGEVSEAGFVTAALAEEEADLAASRGLDIFGGLEGLEWGRIEAVNRAVLRPGQLYVVRNRSGSRGGQIADMSMDTRNPYEPDSRTGQHLILQHRTLQDNEVRDKGAGAGGEALH